MAAKNRKPAPLPCIDLAGKVQVIDFSTNPPRWVTVEEVPVASMTHAQSVIHKHGLKSAWLYDGIDRRLVMA